MALARSKPSDHIDRFLLIGNDLLSIHGAEVEQATGTGRLHELFCEEHVAVRDRGHGVAQVEEILELERSLPLPANERVQSGQDPDERQGAVGPGGRRRTVRKVEAVLLDGPRVVTARADAPEHVDGVRPERAAYLLSM